MKSLPVRRAQFKTADFASWLNRHGAEVGMPTNPYEVIRYRAYEGESRRAMTHIVYAKESGLLTFTGSSKAHYTQFLTGAQLYPSAIGEQVAKAATKAKKRLGRKREVSNREPTRKALLARDGSDCWFCGLPLGDDITIEHLVPKSAGGRNIQANYALAHRQCNNDAADMPLTEKIELRTRLRAAMVSDPSS